MARLKAASRLGCLVAVLLTACSRGAPSAAPSGTRGAAPDTRGAELFQQNCVPCHREDGHGTPGVYPSLAGSPVVTGEPAALARWVLDGVRPATLPAGRYVTQMLRFGWMKDADAAALLTYVRGHFGNEATAIDSATIAHARAVE